MNEPHSEWPSRHSDTTHRCRVHAGFGLRDLCHRIEAAHAQVDVGRLELYASEGLNPESVHTTVLASDEGLVGLVATEANPVNLSEAQRVVGTGQECGPISAAGSGRGWCEIPPS